MNKDRLHEIIIEEVEKLLTEKNSVNYDVLNMAKHYTGIIFKKLNQNDITNMTKRVISTHAENGDVYVANINCKVIQIDVDYRSCEAYNDLNRIIVKIYDFADRDTMQEHYEDCEIGGTSKVYNGIITVNAYSINGKPNLPSIKITLQHELEHFLQCGYGLDITNNKRLQTANANLSNNMNNSSNIIARLYYFFSQNEIDAKMHELYFDIRKQQITSPTQLKKCFAIKEKNKYLELLNKLINDFTDEEINNELSKYGENKKSFLGYMERQMYYFDRKSWKVMIQYFDEMENVKNRKRIRED